MNHLVITIVFFLLHIRTAFAKYSTEYRISEALGQNGNNVVKRFKFSNRYRKLILQMSQSLVVDTLQQKITYKSVL